LTNDQTDLNTKSIGHTPIQRLFKHKVHWS
jgi:hypothetical protein